MVLEKPSSHVWVWELNYKESWVLKNWCFWTVVLEKTLESPLDCKKIQPVHPKGNQSWIFIGRTDAEAETPILWCEELTHWKRPWCWERLKGGGEGHDREWGDWMASPTRWTWVWANFGSWWWTGKPRVLQAMRSQRVRHDWATELTDCEASRSGDDWKDAHNSQEEGEYHWEGLHWEAPVLVRKAERRRGNWEQQFSRKSEVQYKQIQGGRVWMTLMGCCVEGLSLISWYLAPG